MSGSAAAPIAVVGGGLAGIAAALALADHGRGVTLFERRPFLGGRAFSFVDPDTGAVLDNGQHVLAGACTALRRLLSRIGAPPGAFLRQPRLDVPIFDGAGRLESIRAPALPAPFHAVAALARYRHLAPSARLAVARDVRALVSTGPAERVALDPVPLGEWLAERGAPTETLARFWEVLVRPALNVPAAEANLPLAAFFLERAIWEGGAGGALWLPGGGLTESIGEPALEALREAGVDVRLGARVTSIVEDAGRTAGIEADGVAVAAADVVVAVPPRALDRLLATGLAPHGGYGALGASPIVDVYLWYDRRVVPVPFAGVFDSPLQWVFNRTLLLGRRAAGGECLAVSLSAADDLVEASKGEIAEVVDEAVERVFPARAGARRLAVSVVKEPRATFRAGPGLTGLRPGPVGPVDGLWIAGDWTATGWPATMEGAVRSGEAAARALLSRSEEPLTRPDRPARR